MLKKDVNSKWKGAIIDYIYSKEEIHKNIFAHVRVVHEIPDEKYLKYYEIMIPSLEFYTCYIEEKKIIKFLD
tara:strand:+ start:1519 stop:1734 length:216 start_codon:yes stop_codon:yes gene_type:complete